MTPNHRHHTPNSHPYPEFRVKTQVDKGMLSPVGASSFVDGSRDLRRSSRSGWNAYGAWVYVTSWILDLWRRLAEPGQWPRRRVAGESALAAMLAFLTSVLEHLGGHGVLRISLVSLAVVASSLLRRALPVPALIAAGALSAFASGSSLLIVAGWSAGRRIEGVLRVLAAFCTSFVLYMALVPWPRSSVLFLFESVFFLVFTVVPGLAGRYWTQRRTLLSTLRELNVQLLRERHMIAGQARMRERQRIAQDMHDNLGHQLTLIAVHTGALEVDRHLTGEQRKAVGVLRDASTTAMRELRTVVGILSHDTAELPPKTRGPKGLAGIEGLIESAAVGTRVRLDRSGEFRPLAPETDHAGYRVVQEGLTNAFKHAPGAPITVSLRYEPDSLVVEISNGPAPQGTGGHRTVVSGGQGLTGLRERARLADGMVHAGPAEDGGFRLAAVFPYDSGKPWDDAGKAPAALDAVAGDFRGQSGTLASREGEPVIDRLDPREELVSVMRTGAKKNGILVGCGIIALILVAVVAVGLLGLRSLGQQADKAVATQEEYESVKVGEPEAQVRSKLPSGKSPFVSGLKDKVPAGPAGGSCLVLRSGSLLNDSATATVYRFCFKDGKLSEKRKFRVKQ